jgi:hypothetical protein
MKKIIVFLLIVGWTKTSFTQNNPSSAINTPEQQEVINLSKQKWDWMANKNIDSLNPLFDDKAMFVHMGGSWGKLPNSAQ